MTVNVPVPVPVACRCIYVHELPPCAAAQGDEVLRVLFAEDGERVVDAALLDLAVAGEILAGGVADDEIVRQEALRAGVVAGRKVDLRQPEGIFIVV